MISTETTVRQQIVDALEGISVGLGFSDKPNIKDYLVEFEQPENRLKYLTAQVNGRPQIRCWAVSVMSSESPQMLTNGIANVIVARMYAVTLRAYYRLGNSGEGMKLLVDHARLVRGAIYSIGPKLNGTVEQFLGISDLQIGTLNGIDAEGGTILEATMVADYKKTNPDF